MENICPICYCELDEAKSTTKCGHTFCTSCLLNCMAKNIGTESGSNRTKCPICRTKLIEGEVEPSFTIINRMDDLKEELEFLREEKQFLHHKFSLLNKQMEQLKEDYRKSEFIAEVRKNVIYQLKGQPNKVNSYVNSAINIQKWYRMIRAKNQLTLIKAKIAWRAYKSRVHAFYQ